MNLYVAEHKEEKQENLSKYLFAKCKKGEETGTFMYTVILNYTWNHFLAPPVFYYTATAKILFLGLWGFENRVAANQALRVYVILGGLSLPRYSF